MRKNNFVNFIEYFGFDLMSDIRDVGSFERLLYGERSYNNTRNVFSYYNPDKFPDRDHSMVFKIKGTKKIVFVNQPYHFDLDKLENWCKERNLIYVNCHDTNSFYYPGNSCMVLVMSQDTYMEFLKLYKFPTRWENCVEDNI